MTTRIPDFHVITDATLQSRFSHVEIAAAAAIGGATAVQFREKRDWETSALVDVATAIVRAAGDTATVIVNDRVDVAMAAGVRAVHLGPDDVDPATARRLLGPGACVGGTANDLAAARRVAASGVDYLGVGPVFGTRSKANPAPELGLDGLAAIVRAVDVPVIAIGSIDAARVGDVLATGAHGIAVLSAVACADDPAAAAATIRDAIDAHAGSVR